ncbi:TonB-dependent siderophore receptor [Caulobacter sp. UNC358MFTsu5.1]|uniref:TonB-dependent receptor plug domain-containing protein n=1 Tax=Caulobacter sp. UNC358MFTsu5.1 TaxID=1449049 RepID=UPI00068C42B1|nr:TonB-dependent receptor [Caulobacter sp. UNC358MFTsu5.1]
MKKTLLAGVSATFILSMAATAAHAQSIDYGAMEQLFNEPVTTSATGSPQRSTEVPVAMEIISADDIKRSGAVDLPTILSRVAGLDVLNWGAGASDVSVRGYDQAMSPRLLVLINGRQVYLDHYGYTAWATLPVQLSEIRQIEVVKGPNSALFGFNAVGGVVNIITQNPKFDSAGSINLTGGTNGYGELSVVKSVKLGDRFFARLSAGTAQMDEYGRAGSTVLASQVTDPARVSANLDTITQLTEKTELRVEGSWSNVQVSEAVSNYSYSPSKYVTTSVKATLASDTKLGLLQASAYETNLTAKQLVASQQARFENKLDVVSVQDLFKIGAQHTFRIGGEYRKNEVNTAPLAGGQLSYEVVSVSGMWNWAISDKLAVTAAGRYDDLSLSREGTFPAGYPAVTNAYWDRSIKKASYNFGAVYRPTQADTFKLTAARGVQVPTLVDLGAVQLRATAGPYTVGVIGNPTLAPSIVTNYEIGYERPLPGLDAKAGVSVFRQKTEDVKGQPTSGQIDVMPTAPGVLPLLSYRNIGDSKMWGVELTASGKIEGGFHWSGDWTFTDVDDEAAAGFSPQVRLAAFSATTPETRANVSFGWANAQWAADGFFHYTGDHKAYLSTGALVSVEDYVTLGGRVARTFDHGITLAVSGQNLTDGHQRQTAGLEVERRAFVTLSKAW